MNRAVVLPIVPLRGHFWVGLDRSGQTDPRMLSVDRDGDDPRTVLELLSAHAVPGNRSQVVNRGVVDCGHGLERLHVWALRLSPANGLGLAGGQVAGPGAGHLSWMLAPSVDGHVLYGRLTDVDSLAAWALLSPVASAPAPTLSRVHEAAAPRPSTAA